MKYLALLSLVKSVMYNWEFFIKISHELLIHTNKSYLCYLFVQHEQSTVDRFGFFTGELKPSVTIVSYFHKIEY